MNFVKVRTGTSGSYAVPKENWPKKRVTEANFCKLVSYLLYTYLKESTEKLGAKSILWAKVNMRILQRLALKKTFFNVRKVLQIYGWVMQ